MFPPVVGYAVVKVESFLSWGSFSLTTTGRGGVLPSPSPHPEEWIKIMAEEELTQEELDERGRALAPIKRRTQRLTEEEREERRANRPVVESSIESRRTPEELSFHKAAEEMSVFLEAMKDEPQPEMRLATDIAADITFGGNEVCIDGTKIDVVYVESLDQRDDTNSTMTFLTAEGVPLWQGPEDVEVPTLDFVPSRLIPAPGDEIMAVVEIFNDIAREHGLAPEPAAIEPSRAPLRFSAEDEAERRAARQLNADAMESERTRRTDRDRDRNIDRPQQ